MTVDASIIGIYVYTRLQGNVCDTIREAISYRLVPSSHISFAFAVYFHFEIG